MRDKNLKDIRWDFFSGVIVIVFSVLQITRWRIMPQSMDTYYHLLSGWGFLQAGGYSGWDFWQYAPVGRVHIYPPFLHLFLALFIKIGVSQVILAKLLETITPVLFLATLRYFIRKNFSPRLAFFVLVAAGSSFSFYMSLINNIPATMAFVFGFLALSQLLRHRLLRACLLLALCFYTHIGVSWFFILSVILCALFDKRCRKPCFLVSFFAFILSSPILFKQLMGLRFISALGFDLNESYLCDFKTLDYALALCGLIFILKKEEGYRLFVYLFLASFVFLVYPFRFFSAQGYLPVILFSAVSLDSFYERKEKFKHAGWLLVLLAFYLFIFSPTLSTQKNPDERKINYKFYLFDSAFTDMLLPLQNTRIASTGLWHDREYLSASQIIKDNSLKEDIIYSTLNLSGMTLASISERVTANALFPEIKASRDFDRFSVSRVIIFAQDDDLKAVSAIVKGYNLVKIGENKIFIFYKNPAPRAKAEINKASVPFGIIIIIGIFFLFLYWH